MAPKTICQHAKGEQWGKQREEHAHTVYTKSKRKAEEKASTEMAKSITDEEARKARIRARLWEIAEEWLTKEEPLPPADYRRIAQTCMEMGVFEGAAQNGEAQGVILMPEVEEVVEQ